MHPGTATEVRAKETEAAFGHKRLGWHGNDRSRTATEATEASRTETESAFARWIAAPHVIDAFLSAIINPVRSSRDVHLRVDRLRADL